MQAVMDRHEAKASATPQEQGNASVLHFPLLEGIAPGCTLFLNTTLKTFSAIAIGPHSPLLLKERQFTSAELSLLRPLLESFPHYCPYEVLHASLYNGTISDDVVAVSRKQLQKALDEGTWNQEMSPLRNVLSRVRLKLRDMGINIASILETGYILDKRRPPRRAESAGQPGRKSEPPGGPSMPLPAAGGMIGPGANFFRVRSTGPLIRHAWRLP